MLTKRLIVCLDVRNRKVTKGVKFKGNIDIGDPVEMGAQYSADGVSFSVEQDSAGSLMPYFVVDYTSEVQFSGQMSIPVTITFESPWQDVSAKCTIVVRGI